MSDQQRLERIEDSLKGLHTKADATQSTVHAIQVANTKQDGEIKANGLLAGEAKHIALSGYFDKDKEKNTRDRDKQIIWVVSVVIGILISGTGLLLKILL